MRSNRYWTTRSSTSSSAITARRRRARCRARSTRWPTSTAWPTWRPPNSCCPSSTSSAAKTPTATTPWGGRGRWIRRISGPSRWPRTGAAPATAPSCTGPTESRTRAAIRNQFTHVIDLAPTVLEAAGIPAADDRQWRPAEPLRGHQPAVQLQRRRRAGAARDAVFRDVLQPRHLPQGLERGDQAPHALADGRAGDAGLRRRRLGTLRRHVGLDAVQRPLEGEPGETA